MHVEDKINKYCNLSEPFKLYFESPTADANKCSISQGI